MTAIQLLSCAGLIVGAFLLLHLKPVEFTDSLFAFLLRPKKGIRDKLKESSGRKKPGIFRREIGEAQAVLEMTGRGSHFSIVCAVSLGLFCLGVPLPFCLGIFFWLRSLQWAFYFSRFGM